MRKQRSVHAERCNEHDGTEMVTLRSWLLRPCFYNAVYMFLQKKHIHNTLYIFAKDKFGAAISWAAISLVTKQQEEAPSTKFFRLWLLLL